MLVIDAINNMVYCGCDGLEFKTNERVISKKGRREAYQQASWSRRAAQAHGYARRRARTHARTQGFCDAAHLWHHPLRTGVLIQPQAYQV